MKKIKPPYEKTVVIWKANKTEQEQLKIVIEELGYKVVVCKTKNELFSVSCFVIVTDGRKILKDFFKKMPLIYPFLDEMLESGEVTMLYYGEMGKLNYDPPDYVLNIKIDDKDGLHRKLKECESKVKEFAPLRKLRKEQLGRLFYMYSELVKNKQIDRHDVMMKAGVSRNTVHRDIKFIKKFFPMMKIMPVGSVFKLDEENEAIHNFK